MARPSSYTEEIADEICERLANGETLVSICEDEHLPTRQALDYWQETVPGFLARYARAREAQAEFMDHKILVTAEKSTPESAIADRVKIDAYKWRASHLNQARYGKKVAHDHKGETKVIVRHDLTLLTLDELDAFERYLSKATVIDGRAEGSVREIAPPVR